MEEILFKVTKLQCLNPAVHWFCDRKEDTPQSNGLGSFTPEGHEDAEVESVEARRELIFASLVLLGSEDFETATQKDFLIRGMDHQLGQCDLCIVEYYKAKRSMMLRLRDEYDDDDVTRFGNIIDTHDTDRISRGLNAATLALRNVPPEQRGQNQLGRAALMSMFEAMSCESFIADYDLLQQQFEEPFQLVQTNRKLGVAYYLPAVTLFLFDPNQSRCQWALKTWSRYSDHMTKEDFDFAIRHPLSLVLAQACVPTTDTNFIHRLWCGLNLIVDKLDNDLITHSLRAMEIDIFRLALDHLLIDTAGLRFLLQTIQKLLERAPRDFWDAMGAIPPSTVIEQIFNNPQCHKFLLEAAEDEVYEISALKDMLSWIEPFMASLPTSQQPAACRVFTLSLMEKLQVDRFPQSSRIKCYEVGLTVLTYTLISCNKDYAILDAVGRAVTTDTLDVTSKFIQEILSISSLSVDNVRYVALAEPGLKVIKSALALECKSLKTNQETLECVDILPKGFSSYTLTVWRAVVQKLDHGNVLLAKAALSGISDLTGLEKFPTKEGNIVSKDRIAFNFTYRHLTRMVCQMLARIDEFDPKDLETLFDTSETAIALVACLFSPEAEIYEAGVKLIKSISVESARKEAIAHMLSPYFETSLNSFSWSVGRIARKRTFRSCPRMLKTCTDVIDILCDSQDGLLRSRQFSTDMEVSAVKVFWGTQWRALMVIYEMTEEWAGQVHDNNFMKDFCRDTMEFSEHFFDQYSVFTNTLTSADNVKEEVGPPESSKLRTQEDLLKHPARTIESMVKWLRLKDDYLASTCVSLIKKILFRLGDCGMGLSNASSRFLEQVVSSRMKTMLTPQERIELAQPLERILGRSILITNPELDQSDTSRSQTPVEDVKSNSKLVAQKKLKTGTIDLDTWNSRAKKRREIVEIADDDEFDDSQLPDEDILSMSQSVERMKDHPLGRSLIAKASKSQISNLTPVGRLPLSKVTTHTKSDISKQAAQASFKEKREKEIQAKKKRDAEALARAKKNIPSRGINAQPGEGSALTDLGVKGKDHAPKASGMMVSSGSDTESDDELDQVLFGGQGKAPRVSAAVREYQASKLAQLKAQGPVKKTRQVRSAKDMRARLAPNLSSLHKIILSWDFFQSGSFPPNSGKDDYSLVTNIFRTPVDYRNTFEPLLVLEAWQGFLKSKEEQNFQTFEVKVANRLTVDSFIEVSTSITMADGKKLGIGEADIVLLSKSERPASDPDQPNCLARVFKISRKKTAMEISMRVNVGMGLVSNMVPNATLYGMKVSSMTPLEREYGALLGLQYFDLCDEIIKGKASPLLTYSDKYLESIVSNYKVNSAQARAVRSAIDNDAFTLIQGPPGSGKTKTIVAIVGALLTGTLRDKGVEIVRPQAINGSYKPKLSTPTAKKLLVCAPSNAAVDELVMRFKQGVKTVDGAFHKIKIIRLGRSDVINANVQDVTLEEQVNNKLNIPSIGAQTSVGEDIHKLMTEHKAISDQLFATRSRVDEVKSKGQSATPEMYRELDLLKQKKAQLSGRIDLARDRGNTVARDAEINRRKAQQEILEGAHVICATLSGSGHDMFQNLNIEFETVVIDEAAQSIELSALIPLKYGCAKCIMVGDPKQLPPTVLSREAARFQYEQSLFVRMQANHPEAVHLLDTQYRMHPEISLFPSKAFYEGKLLDGKGMASLRRQPWHENDLFSPYCFFNVEGMHQAAPSGHSLINRAELEIALNLYDRLIASYTTYDFKGKIGIITPYKSQLRELRSRFVHRYGEDISNNIEFNTTDAFQGRESEIIIFSCVRASPNQGIGFLSDIRRMNVGITRAKSSLWILGNAQSLVRGEFWNSLIQDAKSRQRYMHVNLQDQAWKGNLSSSIGGTVPLSLKEHGVLSERLLTADREPKSDHVTNDRLNKTYRPTVHSGTSSGTLARLGQDINESAATSTEDSSMTGLGEPPSSPDKMKIDNTPETCVITERGSAPRLQNSASDFRARNVPLVPPQMKKRKEVSPFIMPSAQKRRRN